MTRFIPLALGLALLPLHATAQEASKNQPDIVVTGKLDAQIDALIRRLAPSKNDRQVARWDNRVCAKVLGLSPDRAAYLTDRIATVAKSIGVEPAPSAKCTPNVLIVFTPSADAFAADVVKNHPNYIQNVDLFGLPHGQLRASYLAPRAVRWFAINKTGMADDVNSGDSTPKSSDDVAPPLSFSLPTRMGPRTRENIILSLIVVDEPKMAGFKWSQLGDYLAMVSLSQPRMDADYSIEDSVLALFTARDAGKPIPAGLTVQDKTFLTALYKSDPVRFANQQQRQIANGLKKGSQDRND